MDDLLRTERTESEAYDNRIVSLAMQGDKAAFEQLFIRSYRAMYNVVSHFLTNDENIYDALQDGYLKAYRKLNTLSAPEAFYSWLTVIMKNSARDILRENESLPLPEVAAPDESEDAERRADIREALKRMDPEHARVLTLYYYDGLKLKEIAALTGVTVATVHKRLNAAKAELATLLSARGIDSSMYGGSLLTMIGVALRSVLGTDLLSAAIAQKMMEDVMSGKPGKLEKAAYQVAMQQRNRRFLKIAGLLLTVLFFITCFTSLLTLALTGVFTGSPHTSATPATTSSTSTSFLHTSTSGGTTTTSDTKETADSHSATSSTPVLPSNGATATIPSTTTTATSFSSSGSTTSTVSTESSSTTSTTLSPTTTTTGNSSFTNSSTTTTTLPQVPGVYHVGKVENGVYINDYLGIRYELPNHFYFGSEHKTLGYKNGSSTDTDWFDLAAYFPTPNSSYESLICIKEKKIEAYGTADKQISSLKYAGNCYDIAYTIGGISYKGVCQQLSADGGKMYRAVLFADLGVTQIHMWISSRNLDYVNQILEELSS